MKHKKGARALSLKLKSIRMLNSKRSFEVSFAWLFAVFAGAIILFLAIYGTSQVIKTGIYQIDTVTAKQLSIIFEPMETGLASGKSNVAELKEETRIYNRCLPSGSFGEHRISLATKSGFGKSWQEPGPEGGIPVGNKYIFSSDVLQGKKVYFFSKPFQMPWKVSELIYLTTEEYCFMGAPEEIKEEIIGLNIQNIKIENCSDEINICFGSGMKCNATIRGNCFGGDCKNNYDSGIVSKNNEQLYYYGFVDNLGYVDRSLLYAAIFSDKDIYECNVKRLMKRLSQQAGIFSDETNFLAGKCGAINPGMINIIGLAGSIDSSGKLNIILDAAREVDKQNEASICKLW